MRQAALQATGLVILPVAALIVLPMAWAYAFYQNLSVLDGPETKTLKQLYQEALRQQIPQAEPHALRRALAGRPELHGFFAVCEAHDTRPGGVHTINSPTPATRAGTAFMITVEAYAPSPPGTYRPARRTGK